MDALKKNLHNIGLDPDEVTIYLRALELGSATVLQFAQKVDIPRTTIYLLIDSLIEKGLLIQTTQGKRKLFVAAPPDKLLHIADEKKMSIDRTLHSLYNDISQLKALYNLKIDKPKVRYYEGVEGLKEIYEETLLHTHICIHSMTQHGAELLADYLPGYYDRLTQRMIFTQEIVSDSTQDKQYQHNYSTARNEVLCIPAKYATNTDYLIYGDTVTFITYKAGKPYAIAMEDKEIVHFERIRFLMLWNVAKQGIFVEKAENYTPISGEVENTS